MSLTMGARPNPAPAFPGQPTARTTETYRQHFAEFVAVNRGIDASRALELVSRAEGQFLGGWGGQDYRRFTELALETFRPLYDETSDAELIRTYQFHGPVDFLRMIGYSIPTLQDIGPIIKRLAGNSKVEILDYGCGLAHRTFAVARYLLTRNVDVKLTFVDIQRDLHFDFLNFLCRKHGINHDFIEITAEELYPPLPAHDYSDNVSVLEHIRDPLAVIENTNRSLRPGGVFLAAIEDEIEEMMHISPNLKAVRDRLAALGYIQVAKCCGVPLLQKPLESSRQFETGRSA
jgi:SAM-dependent methyltransferase